MAATRAQVSASTSGGGTWVTEDAVAVQVLLHGQVHRAAVGPAGHHHAQLTVNGNQGLQHAGAATHRLPGGGQFGRRRHPGLALAVITELRGLQDARQQVGADAGQVGLGLDAGMGCARHAAAGEVSLLQRAVLTDAHRAGRR